MPKLYPALKAAMLAASTSGLEANFSATQSSVVSCGRSNIQARAPSAKKFLERRTSRPFTPLSLTASFVNSSIGAVRTLYPSRRAVLERVGVVARLGEVALLEAIGVDDDDATGLEVVDVLLEGGRVHRHQHVGRIARRENVAAGDVDLEGGDAGQGAGRGPDLGREVGKGGEVVAEGGGGIGEPGACQLHAIAGVSGEADDYAFA